MKWVAADFETSNSPVNIEKEYTRVWLWDVFDPELRKHFNGYDIESFFEYLFSQNSRILYFHNLKFDGSFIIYYLLNYNFVINDSKQSGTISTLITDRLIWYTFTVYYKGRKYIFRDSSKKIIGSLEKAAKDFELPISKGEIEYDLHRDEGYIPTLEEIKYCQRDTEILADIMEYYYENGMTGITNASDALKAYKEIVSENGYRMYFPTLPKSMDDFIRRSYKGGFCWLNPIHFNEDLRNVYCYDVKSMYPSVMHDKPLPFGVPLYYDGEYERDDTYPLFIQEINVCCHRKKGCVPAIQTKSFMGIKLNYLEDTEGRMQNMILTSVDLELLYENYEIEEIDFVRGLKFQCSTELFKQYIDYYFELKEKSTGAKKQLYKIFLNSLYGKFAMMTERIQAIPNIENDRVHFNRTQPQTVDPIYTAAASFITSWARKKLIDGINENYENFVYCDTDSMHLLAPAQGVTIGKKLGQFNLEHGYYDENKNAHTGIIKARYLGQKCYVLGEMTSDGTDLIKKIAGAPNKVKEVVTFDNFRINFETDPYKNPKFRMKNVKGGVLLIPTKFTIKQK